jgi:hypothetical protein
LLLRQVILPDEVERMYPAHAHHAALLGTFLCALFVLQLGTAAASTRGGVACGGTQRPFILWGSMFSCWALVLLWAASEYKWFRLYAPFSALALLTLHAVYGVFHSLRAAVLPPAQRADADAVQGAMAAAGSVLGFLLPGLLMNVRDAYPCYALATFFCSIATAMSLGPAPRRHASGGGGARTDTAAAAAAVAGPFALLRAMVWPDRARLPPGLVRAWAARVAFFAALVAKSFVLFLFRDYVGAVRPKLATAAASLLALGGSAVGLFAGARAMAAAVAAVAAAAAGSSAGTGGGGGVAAAQAVQQDPRRLARWGCALVGLGALGFVGGRSVSHVYAAAVVLGVGAGVTMAVAVAQERAWASAGPGAVLLWRGAPFLGALLGVGGAALLLGGFRDAAHTGRYTPGGYTAVMVLCATCAAVAAALTEVGGGGGGGGGGGCEGAAAAATPKAPKAKGERQHG